MVSVSNLLALLDIVLCCVSGLQGGEDVSVECAIQGQVLQTGSGQDTFPLQDVAQQL